MTNHAVDGAVSLAVYWGPYRALYPPVGLAVSLAVYDVALWAINGAVSRREEPPHPGLGIYLGGVA